MKVLHITNWFPTKKNPYTALWIKRHIDALNLHAENIVYHVEVIKGPLSFSFSKKRIEGNYAYIISLPLQIWILTEWISYWIVRYILKREIGKFDIVNFHIAYPLCTHINKIRKLTDKPIVITEHWSAYHFNFGIRGSKKLMTIKRIFQHADHLIVVSRALQNDIEQFTGDLDLPFSVIPNIVDTSIFKYEHRQVEAVRFFMVSNWKKPKNPSVVIEAFKQVLSKYPEATLRIGGYGPQQEEIKSMIDQLKLSDSINFLGKLESMEIAVEMRKATAFIHPSEYETFSVVCAESICCGCPVIAPRIGGIVEFINETNGLLYSNECEVAALMEQAILTEFNRPMIAESGRKFSSQEVGIAYYKTLTDVIR